MTIYLQVILLKVFMNSNAQHTMYNEISVQYLTREKAKLLKEGSKAF